MDKIFGPTKTYITDWPLFRKLGLESFEVNGQEKTFVGTYKFPHYEKASVRIWATCMPAQFWHFEVITDEGKIFLIETGSGTLGDYWDSVEKLATGMLTVEAR